MTTEAFDLDPIRNGKSPVNRKRITHFLLIVSGLALFNVVFSKIIVGLIAGS